MLPGLKKLNIYSDCEELIDKLKRKFLSVDTREDKIQILTLVPNNWSRSRAAIFFNTSECLVRLTRETKHETGIFGIPVPIYRHGYVIETRKKLMRLAGYVLEKRLCEC